LRGWAPKPKFAHEEKPIDNTFASHTSTYEPELYNFTSKGLLSNQQVSFPLAVAPSAPHWTNFSRVQAVCDLDRHIHRQPTLSANLAPNRQAGIPPRTRTHCLGYNNPQTAFPSHLSRLLCVKRTYYDSCSPSLRSPDNTRYSYRHLQPYNPASRYPRLLDPILLQGIGIWSFEDHSV
jgi:hypothetical protein